MQVLLQITGILLIILAGIHVIFPRYFNWKQELANLSTMNRQLMYVHSFFIGLTVSFMGLLCVTSAAELTGTLLGKRILLALAIFWSVRLVFQFFVYSSSIWKGKTFETMIHILISGFWIYLVVVFGLAYLA